MKISHQRIVPSAISFALPALIDQISVWHARETGSTHLIAHVSRVLSMMAFRRSARFVPTNAPPAKALPQTVTLARATELTTQHVAVHLDSLIHKKITAKFALFSAWLALPNLTTAWHAEVIDRNHLPAAVLRINLTHLKRTARTATTTV